MIGSYTVQLREVGQRRHLLLGKSALTRLRVHALTFESLEEAEDAARWMLDHNEGEFDSARVLCERKIARAFS